MERATRILLALAASTASASAQVTFNEIEPNESKTAATVVSCMTAGDMITGVTTGASTTPGNGSYDYFRVQTCPLSLGVYEHRLTLTTVGTAGHTTTIRGLGQTGTVGMGGTPTTAENELQLQQTTPGRYVVWYGFGKQEELYYRVAGTASTTGAYTATLSTTPITPVNVGSFAPGSIRITTQGQGHTTDTDIIVYDSTLTPVPTCQNDDALPAAGLQSNLVRTYGAGTYYLAITQYNLATDQGAAADDNFVTGFLTDFPNLAVQGVNTQAANLPINFAITDSVGTVPITAALNTGGNAHSIAWFRFDVGTPPAFNAFCAGDGVDVSHTTACPCANVGSLGHGCANSVNAAGALLTATGSAPADNVVLNGAGMPGTVACIYLQGTALDDATFGDGVRCAGGTLLRLRTKINSGGASSFPDSVETVTLSQRGGVSIGSGARRYYQAYYRNAAPAFCPPETFNVTNGWVIDW